MKKTRLDCLYLVGVGSEPFPTDDVTQSVQFLNTLNGCNLLIDSGSHLTLPIHASIHGSVASYDHSDDEKQSKVM